MLWWVFGHKLESDKIIYDNWWFKESRIKYIKGDISILKSTIGIVGNADDMINNLQNTWQIKIESSRHVLLIQSQTSLQLMYVF